MAVQFINLEQVMSNVTQVTMKNKGGRGITIVYSYATPIALSYDDRAGVTRSYQNAGADTVSPTTMRHREKLGYGQAVPASRFAEVMHEALSSL